LPNRSEVNELLVKGVTSAKAGQRAEAYNLLLDVVELDRHNELAWLWLSILADNLEDQRICLENVLTINPANATARERLTVLATNGTPHSGVSPTAVICPQCGAGNRDFVRECGACGYAFFRRCVSCGEFNPTDAPTCSQCGISLTRSVAQTVQPVQQPTLATSSVLATSPPPTPVTLWPVVAFWVGVSVLFSGGGIAALFQFAGTVLRARGVLQSLQPIEVAWLPVGLFFIVFGLTGMGLAWQLARRRPAGYYGSLVFGLVLTLLGPSASLVLEPPNYLTTACTGLMPAAAVLFTLASSTGFEADTYRL
jgi:ribosomal protein L40E